MSMNLNLKLRNTIGCVLWAGVAVGLALGGCADFQTVEPIQPRTTLTNENASYTILLCVTRGENHMAEARNIKGVVERSLSWNEVFVVNKAGWSEVYRGRYVSMEEAQGDLKKARTWRDSLGAQPFAQAMVMALPGKEVGPPEWNLLRTTGVFTVVVAEFYDVPESSYVGRKDFAVRCCREFRAEKLEAYYYHGPAKSFVCIGSFPEASYPSVQEGGEIKRVVKDERIKTILKRFPFLAVNGRQEVLIVRGAGGKTRKLATGCYIMGIPRQEDASGANPFSRSGYPQRR
jgi:hypothetical protein